MDIGSEMMDAFNKDRLYAENQDLRERVAELEAENEELKECFDECYEELGKVQHELNNALKEKGE